METYTYSPTQPFESNRVPITWGAEQKSDYFNQIICQYKRTLGIVDGCEHISSITNSFARKSQGTNDVGNVIVNGMTIGGHIANGLGYGMTRANLVENNETTYYG